MANIGHYNADEHNPEGSRAEAFPPCVADLVLTGSDLKQVKGKPGHQYLAFEFTVCSGDNQNRKIFENLNIRNSNAQTERIANDNLAALCFALGKRQFEDTVELHGIPFRAEIEVEAAKDGYPAKNKINWPKTYKLAEMQKVEGDSHGANAAPATSGSKPAWSAG